MNEVDYGKALAEMAAEPVEADEAPPPVRRQSPRYKVRPDDRRTHNRGTPGNAGGASTGKWGKPRKLVLNGVQQDGMWRVQVSSDTVSLRLVDAV